MVLTYEKSVFVGQTARGYLHTHLPDVYFHLQTAARFKVAALARDTSHFSSGSMGKDWKRWSRDVSREGLSRKLAGKHTPDEELQRKHQDVTRRSHLPVTLRPAVMVWPLSFSSPTPEPELVRVRPLARVGMGDVAAEDILSDIVVLARQGLTAPEGPCSELVLCLALLVRL